MITFDNLANGQMAARFQMALHQIGHNLMDPNMDPDAARGMTVNISFKPDGNGVLKVKFDIKTKLAGFNKSGTTLLIGQDARTGQVEIREHGSREPGMTIAAANYPVQAETIPPQRDQPQEFDPSTGEIYEPQRGPIDLRAVQ
jgi:hypothetical protein